MYQINKSIKWFSKQNYLELYHPKSDNIMKIDYKYINVIWEIITTSNSFEEISKKILNNNLFSSIHIETIYKLFKQLSKNSYIIVEGK